jgi:hypothetical protein
VAQKYLDQQSVLLTWNGPWGEFSQDPLLHEAWQLFFFSGAVAMLRGTLYFHSAQISEGGFRSRPWARSHSFCDAIHGLTSCYSCLKQRWWIGKGCFKPIRMQGHWNVRQELGGSV